MVVSSPGPPSRGRSGSRRAAASLSWRRGPPAPSLLIHSAAKPAVSRFPGCHRRQIQRPSYPSPRMGENPKSLEPAPPSRPSSPTPLIGSTVAHYRILERLRGGGMGVVYKGWDLRLERYAAVKFLSPQRRGSHDFQRRFTPAARTASRLE